MGPKGHGGWNEINQVMQIQWYFASSLKFIKHLLKSGRAMHVATQKTHLCQLTIKIMLLDKSLVIPYHDIKFH